MRKRTPFAISAITGVQQRTRGLLLSPRGPKNLLSNVTNCFTSFASRVDDDIEQKATAAGDVCQRCTSASLQANFDHFLVR